MRRIGQAQTILAAVVIIGLPLSKSYEVVSASNGLTEERSALCNGRILGNNSLALIGALMRFARIRPGAIGLPWDEIPSLSHGKSSAPVPVIVGLPLERAQPHARALLGLAQTVDVSVVNNSFNPGNVTISAGDTVRWTWQASFHSVTSGQCSDDCVVDNKFCSPSDVDCVSSAPSGAGFIYSHQFNEPGNYPYFCNVHLGLMSGTVIVQASTTPTIQFTAGSFAVAESGGSASITVSRSGPTTSAATADYATSDTAGLTNCNVVNGVGSPRCDYATSVGIVRFAVGETSKTISIPIVDDSYAEGNENFTITLSNATGASLGAPATATVTINDNEATNGANPIDGTAFFVRQQYVDFLGREPDPGGFAAWQAVINNCPPNDTTCDRIHVSSGFFRSPEFQERGYFVYRFYPVAFGRKPEYVEFIPDLAKVSGFLSAAELEAARVAFIAEFMNRPAFVTKFSALNNTQYVDTLLSTAQITHSNRDFWIGALGNGTRTRAQVLREIVESTEVFNKYFNQAFVVMQYFGYLRRDPDAFYLDWIAHLDSSNDFRSMINGFMNSLEYRFRFGP